MKSALTHNDWKRIQTLVVDQYQMSLFGIHGISHWSRVSTLGTMLAEKENADADIVRLFAILHDACRLTDGSDMEHGPRASKLVRKWYEEGKIPITIDQSEILAEACRTHTTATICEDTTIQCCLDADRLDLCRLGIKADPARLFTETAKKKEVRHYAEELFWLKEKPSQGLRF